MMLLTGGSSYVQLITVLIVFVFVLGLTAWLTKWLSEYQKQQGTNCNIEVIETSRISNNKYIQIVRVGATYVAMAVCKDTVTVLCQVPEEQLQLTTGQKQSFKELLDKMLQKDSGNSNEPKEDVHED
ncbi:MAG: flagellar biosynthetic protein FliO [Lachnospiraceae bacterium]|nr:flagellar biosynthetic protein FliO [Lachnospiraceae bacterium]